MVIVVSLEGEGQGAMVSEHVIMKNSTFHKMPEVANGQIHSQELPVTGAVPCLSRLQLLGEVGDWRPGAIDEVPQDCSHSMARGVSGGASWGVGGALWLEPDWSCSSCSNSDSASGNKVMGALDLALPWALPGRNPL